jgi:transcriptional regulator with XRE-family HTH domain
LKQTVPHLNLKIERELRGVSLEEMAAASKLPLSHLQALESNDFEKLPSGLFLRGYLRVYSEYLGLDPDMVILDYEYAQELYGHNVQERSSRLLKDFRPQPVLLFVVVLAVLLTGLTQLSSESGSRKSGSMAIPPQENHGIERSDISGCLDNWSQSELSVEHGFNDLVADTTLITSGPIQLTVQCGSWIRRYYPSEGREILESVFFSDVLEYRVDTTLFVEIGSPDCVQCFDRGKKVHIPEKEQVILCFHPPEKNLIIQGESLLEE